MSVDFIELARLQGHVFWDDFDVSHLPKMHRAVYEDVLARFRAWKGEHSIVLLSVPTGANTGYGVGKTMMMRALWSRFSRYSTVEQMDDVLIRYNTCPFLTASELVSQLNEEPARERFVAMPNAIFVDDIGREADRALAYIGAQRKESQVAILFAELINWAWEKHVPLVMSANMSVSDLQSFLGGASWDRLIEMTNNAGFIVLDGFPSYRVKRVRE